MGVPVSISGTFCCVYIQARGQQTLWSVRGHVGVVVTYAQPGAGPLCLCETVRVLVF